MASASEIDAVLRRAVEAGEVPGVVALAATDRGILYEGAFGRRDLAAGPAMTLDTIFRIASMTKAVTSVAAMQLVEAGKLALDEPIGSVLPELAAPYVLQGFDPSGKPRLRPAKRPITLRHLLTHTAGFGYDMLNSELIRYIAVTHTPSIGTGELASLRLPLLFDPGEGWQYGINIDWVGRAVEAASGQAARRVFPRPYLRPARHERQRLCAVGRAGRAAGPGASAQGGRIAGADRDRHAAAQPGILGRRRRTLLDRPRLSETFCGCC